MSNIIREVETNELICCCSWVIVSCDLSDITSEKIIQNLENKFNEILESFPILKVRFQKESSNENFSYCTQSEIQFNKLILLPKSFEEYNQLKPSFSYDLYSEPHWRLLIIQKPNNKVGIKMYVCHSICDGRSAFEFLELFCVYIKEETLPQIYKNNIGLNILNKDRRNYFTKNIMKNSINYIQSWSNITKNKVFKTKIDLEKDELTNIELEYEYEPIKRFIIKNKVSIQGIISALYIWAFNKYNKKNLENEVICIYTPIDSRYLKYSTEEYKNLLFGNNYSVIIPAVKYYDDKLKQILECQKSLREALNSDEALEYFILLKDISIQEMCKRQDQGKFPRNVESNIITTSHIGRVPERGNIKFNFYYPLNLWGYLPNYYAYHNNKKIMFTLLSTNSMDQYFIQCVTETTDEFIEFISNYN